MWFRRRIRERITIDQDKRKVHEYLDMTLDFSQHQQVKFYMQDYIKSIVTDSPEDMAGVAPTPAANHFFLSIIKNPYS